MPGNLGVYTYAVNNPVILKDSSGANWFKVRGSYEWHRGNTYRGVKSNFTHFLEFTKTGVNDVDGATGTLKLYDQNRVIAEAPSFSGGGGHGEIPGGTYTINLRNRGIAQAAADLTPPDKDGNRLLKPFFGVQQIAVEIPDGKGAKLDFRYEWGSKRARLTPDLGESGAAFQGNYIHGKERTEGGDYTHGCVCDRDERVLDSLFGLSPSKTPIVPVQVRDNR
jgi:hypothetical protein